MERSEEILDRIEQQDLENNPLRLVSERLPALVEEKIKEAFQTADSDAHSARSEIREAIRGLEDLPGGLEKLHDDLNVLSSHAATREFLQTGIEDLQKKAQRLEVLFIESCGPAVAEQPNAEKKDPPAEKRGPVSGNAADVQPQPEATPHEEEAETPDTTDEDNEPDQEPEAELEKTQEVTPSEIRTAAKRTRKTEIIVSAFVGIQNGIFLRGDGPGLDPVKGVRLEMTGIGEWAWHSEEVSDRFAAELFLNDERPSSLGAFTVSPGDTLKLNPTFRPAD